jgi:hypothetical protein
MSYFYKIIFEYFQIHLFDRHLNQIDLFYLKYINDLRINFELINIINLFIKYESSWFHKFNDILRPMYDMNQLFQLVQAENDLYIK